MRSLLAVLFSVFLLPRIGQCQIADLARNQLTPSTYDSATILKTANELIAAGQTKAHESLLAYANNSSQPDSWGYRDQYVTWLCLLLYEPKSRIGLKTPLFGAPNFPFGYDGKGYEDPDLWPKFPLAISQGVPFELVEGYTLGGLALPGSYYVTLYQEKGLFRTKSYPIPTHKQAELALKALLTSDQWKALTWKPKGLPVWSEASEIDFLRAQVQRTPP
jgi:hypothetical protein